MLDKTSCSMQALRLLAGAAGMQLMTCACSFCYRCRQAPHALWLPHPPAALQDSSGQAWHALNCMVHCCLVVLCAATPQQQALHMKPALQGKEANAASSEHRRAGCNSG
jgi:hypothetical protein